jgi:hypothetical protein
VTCGWLCPRPVRLILSPLLLRSRRCARCPGGGLADPAGARRRGADDDAMTRRRTAELAVLRAWSVGRCCCAWLTMSCGPPGRTSRCYSRHRVPPDPDG